MEISIDSPQASFDKHLQQDQNERILFSGKFGTGKSYFLKKYFEQRKDQYNLFWISPVDYVVGANQDIFEWIKIDIAKQLVLNYIEKEEQKKVPKRQVIALYVMNNIGKVFTDIAMFVAQPKVDEIFGQGFFEILEKHHRKAEQLGAAINEPGDDDKITKYVSAYTQLTGTIYEDNSITQLIRAAITTIAASAEKENILIIDDLDRLDPEHIFRILNILSAHNNHFESNKFGFNKVILVCDFENIKHIFKHKYGADCDFNGYIEKFYSYEPFHYNLKNAVAMYCKGIDIVSELSPAKQKLIQYLLVSFVTAGRLNIRSLRKVSQNKYGKIPDIIRFDASAHIDKYQMSINNFLGTEILEVHLSEFEFVSIVRILVDAFGGINHVISEINLMIKNLIAEDAQIASDLLQSLFDDVMILSNLSKNKNIKGYFEYLSKTIGHRTQNVFKYPQLSVSHECRVPLIWTNNNLYRGGHFFQLRQDESLFYNFNNTYHIDKISIFFVLSEIQSAIEYLASQNIFSRPAH